MSYICGINKIVGDFHREEILVGVFVSSSYFVVWDTIFSSLNIT